MKLLAVMVGAFPLVIAAPAAAQMDHSAMSGMHMPEGPVAKPKPKAKAKQAVRRATTPKPAAKSRVAADAHAGHTTPQLTEQRLGGAQDPTPEPATAADPHAGHDMSGMDTAGDASAMGTGGTALPAGKEPAPAAREASYADRIWGRDTMIGSRTALRREHGGGTFSQVMFNLAEIQVRDGREGYRWDGEAWFGGDINRVVVQSEGSGDFGDRVDDAEVQLLYSRAIDPYFNLRAGVRYDFKPSNSRTYATVGFEGLAPYWFEVEGALFLSDKGDVLGRLEGYYDQRITQRLILQPRVEANFAAQDVPENSVGWGLSDIELGLRLRYEIKRELAFYLGVSYDCKIGRSARLARADRETVGGASFVLGVRTWF